MAEKEDKLDSSIGTILTAMVSIIVLAYVAIPIISDAIGSLTGEKAATYGSLLSVVVIIMIVGIIIFVIRGYNNHGR